MNITTAALTNIISSMINILNMYYCTLKAIFTAAIRLPIKYAKSLTNQTYILHLQGKPLSINIFSAANPFRLLKYFKIIIQT